VGVAEHGAEAQEAPRRHMALQRKGHCKAWWPLRGADRAGYAAFVLAGTAAVLWLAVAGSSWWWPSSSALWSLGVDAESKNILQCVTVRAFVAARAWLVG
jgi:hypothetical protein